MQRFAFYNCEGAAAAAAAAAAGSAAASAGAGGSTAPYILDGAVRDSRLTRVRVSLGFQVKL